AAAIGETVGRYIEDAHQYGGGTESQPPAMCKLPLDLNIVRQIVYLRNTRLPNVKLSAAGFEGNCEECRRLPFSNDPGSIKIVAWFKIGWLLTGLQGQGKSDAGKIGCYA